MNSRNLSNNILKKRNECIVCIDELFFVSEATQEVNVEQKESKCTANVLVCVSQAQLNIKPVRGARDYAPQR